MRYFDTNPRAIAGMSKINSTALSSHPKISTGFHFKKEQPAESHVLVQAFNGAETESKVFENTTAIPNTGDFSGTALHTDSGTGQGRFSDAPNGNVAYCNGEEALVWGGDEHFSSGFVNYDPDGAWSNDFTTKVQNTLSDSDNIATLTKVTGDLPPSTGLLLHLDNNVTDSSTSAHTVTNNNVTFTTDSKFGTHAGTFNGTDAYLTVPDHADFDFSGGKFSIDLRFKADGNAGTLYSQATDANNYIRLSYNILLQGLALEVKSGGSRTVFLSTFASNTPNLVTGNYHDVEITENGNDWYLFVDGKLVVYLSDTDRAADYTGDIYIGAFYDGTTVSDYFHGNIDEYRTGGSPLHTDFFEPREVPYGTAAAYINIGAVRPLQGIKAYVETANTAAGTTKVMQWRQYDSGSFLHDTPVHGMWVDVDNVTDGTAITGKPLAQTGSISFDSTIDTISPRLNNNTYLYWYKVIFSEIDDTTTISQLTLDMPMQNIRDLWDGEIRSPIYFEVDTGTNKFDNTINVFEGTYTSTNSATYSDLSALPASGNLLVGYTERMTAIDFRFLAGEVNTNTGRPLIVSYWTGDGWVEAFNIKDDTYETNSPFGKSGIVAWNIPSKSKESTQELGGRPPLYYYKIKTQTTISATCKVYFVGGIPAQKQINGYKFPILSHNRLMLGSNQDDKKNSLLIGAPGTSSIFNGVDYREISFGNDDELVAGSEIFGQFGSDIYNLTLVCKKSEAWLLSEQESSFEWYRVSSTIGCTAPLTMTSIHTPAMEERPALNGVIFQSTDAIYLFDGREFYPIHRDIEDVFARINKTYLDKSVGFLDETNQEWHWLITTGASTTHNEEWVFDLKRDRWYQIDRGTYLQSGFSVEDTVGNFYNYGTIDTGHLERLEDGTTFDGNDMAFSLWTGDVTMTESTMYESQIRNIHLLAKAKNTTSNSIIVTHYGEGATTGTTLAPISPSNTNGRIISRVKSENTGEHVFHSLKLSMTTNDETIGFEPLSLGVFYKVIREHKGIKNN
jgi:hypothetical protein